MADMKKKRVLGDEWLDWDGGQAETDTSESRGTFLYLSLIVLALFVIIVLLFWYLVLPRFESFGKAWAFVITGLLGTAALSLIVWYVVLVIAVIWKRRYMNVCLTRGSRLFFIMLPLVTRLAASLGISKDRLNHSFIRVSNELAGPGKGPGPVLVLFPRCLRADIRLSAREICSGYEDVRLHTAPGGTEARKIIRDTSPGAIVAVACERDLIAGIQDIAPRIPVIGIPNTRPEGPCTDTTIDTSELKAAIEYFLNLR
jgi:hypothetical protein